MTTAPTPSELLTLRADARQQIWMRQKFGPGGLDLELDPAIVIRLLDRIAELEARKPLPSERVHELMAGAGYLDGSAERRADFINGIRHGEGAHGITGGSS